MISPFREGYIFMKLRICEVFAKIKPSRKFLNLQYQEWFYFILKPDCEYLLKKMGQVWYLIVSIPDLCTLTNFISISDHFSHFYTFP